MKKTFTLSIVKLMLCSVIMLSGIASEAQTCYRVFIHLIADPSYYVKHGSSRSQTEQAMMNAMNVAIPAYRQLGIEFVVFSKQVFTVDRPVSNPWFNIVTKDGILNKIRQTFPATLGTGVKVNSPYETGRPLKFVYDMYVVFFDKIIDAQAGLFGSATDFSALYSNQSMAFVTQRAYTVERVQIGETPDGFPLFQDNPVNIFRTESEVQKTFTHELGHLFGADHDTGADCRVPKKLMCQGPGLNVVLSTTARTAINNRLRNHRDNGCTVRTSARMAIAGVSEEPVFEDVEERTLSVSPNPAKGLTTVGFTQEVKGKVTLNVHNLLGQVVKTISPAEDFAEGSHEISVDMTEQQSGLYVFELRKPNRSEKIRVSVEK